MSETAETCKHEWTEIGRATSMFGPHWTCQKCNKTVTEQPPETLPKKPEREAFEFRIGAGHYDAGGMVGLYAYADFLFWIPASHPQAQDIRSYSNWKYDNIKTIETASGERLIQIWFQLPWAELTPIEQMSMTHNKALIFIKKHLGKEHPYRGLAKLLQQICAKHETECSAFAAQRISGAIRKLERELAKLTTANTEQAE